GHGGRDAVVRRQAGVHVLHAGLRGTHGRWGGAVEPGGALLEESRRSVLRGGEVAMGGRSATDRGGAAAVATAHPGDARAGGGGGAHSLGTRTDFGVAGTGGIG